MRCCRSSDPYPLVPKIAGILVCSALNKGSIHFFEQPLVPLEEACEIFLRMKFQHFPTYLAINVPVLHCVLNTCKEYGLGWLLRQHVLVWDTSLAWIKWSMTIVAFRSEALFLVSFAMPLKALLHRMLRWSFNSGSIISVAMTQFSTSYSRKKKVRSLNCGQRNCVHIYLAESSLVRFVVAIDGFAEIDKRF